MLLSRRWRPPGLANRRRGAGPRENGRCACMHACAVQALRSAAAAGCTRRLRSFNLQARRALPAAAADVAGTQLSAGPQRSRPRPGAHVVPAMLAAAAGCTPRLHAIYTCLPFHACSHPPPRAWARCARRCLSANGNFRGWQGVGPGRCARNPVHLRLGSVGACFVSGRGRSTQRRGRVHVVMGGRGRI